MAAPRQSSKSKITEVYQHPESDLPMRPEVGTQPQFKKKKPPQKYRYDSSLSPALEWDGQNPARETAEALIKEIADCGLQIAELARQEPTADPEKEVQNLKSKIQNSESRLRQISGPFLNWSGKAERLSFDVPTLPLFIHERLSTKAIIETLKGHKSDKQDDFLRELWGDPQHSVTDQVLRAYEYRDDWVNRMMLGDSLVVMNSLLRYEALGGQVQMIYMDPPYGVKFGSNFQPFVRKRDVGHNDDEDMTREPEMVQAYRDTWEVGLHSYLTYLRDRLLLARELLHPSGSIFVQISDENLHHVREVMDEVFGAECFIVTVAVKKKGSQKSSLMDPVNDYLLWYGKSSRSEGRTKFRPYFVKRELDAETIAEFKMVELPDGREFPISEMPDPNGEIRDYRLFPKQIFTDYLGARLFASNPLTSGGERKNQSLPFEFKGKEYSPPKGSCFKTPVRTDDGSVPGMTRLGQSNRLLAGEGQLRFKRFLDDFGYIPLSNWWDGLGGASEPLYVVQTNAEIVQRCLLMTTDPGDLVLDPTCGSGTTAYVAEQWGRRWITIDTSRVPLALARQRLLTATFPYYELKEEERGPAGGFVYKRKQNSKGEEVGGIVPHITLKSIANNEPLAEEVLVDRPEVKSGIVRVTGPFTFEATIPTPVDFDSSSSSEEGSSKTKDENEDDYGKFVDRMIEVLRKSPVLRLEGNRTVQLKQIRPPAKSLSLSAEAVVEQDTATPAAGRAFFKKELRTTGATLRFEGKEIEFEPVLDAKDDSGLLALDRQKDSGLIAFLYDLHKRKVGGIVPITSDDYTSLKQGRALTGQSTVWPSANATSSIQAAAVAIVFGPENGAVSEKLVYEAAREANAKNYTHLYVIGFAIQPNARELVEKCDDVVGIPATCVQATPDLMMGDLLKNMRSSQIFSVCGLPEVKVSKVENPKSKVDYKTNSETQYQVELLGLDVFDPISMEVDHQSGNDVPAWFLDTNYNGLCFHVSQAFFPKTGAWENLKKALKGDYEESVWDHLAGTVSAPFVAGEHGQIAVKVIDQRGNELLVVKSLKEAK